LRWRRSGVFVRKWDVASQFRKRQFQYAADFRNCNFNGNCFAADSRGELPAGMNGLIKQKTFLRTTIKKVFCLSGVSAQSVEKSSCTIRSFREIRGKSSCSSQWLIRNKSSKSGR
jgi:hypothetical protein